VTDPDAVIVEPHGPPVASIIWLHGLGADGHDFEPVVHQLRLPARGVRVTLPHAPRRPVTINGGYVMRAWYDVLDPDLTSNPDMEGIRVSAAVVGGYIQAERQAGVAAGRIVLAGFSQGGVIALHTGVRHEERLGGIIALSTYVPLPHVLSDEVHEANRELPVFMAHGEQDPLIPLAAGEASASQLATLGYRVEFHRYPMPHSVCTEEIADIDRWLSRTLGA